MSVSGLFVARAAITGATFMKFGRAPTTKQTLRGIRPAYLEWPRAPPPAPLLGLAGCARVDARPLPGLCVGGCSRGPASGSEGRRRADGHRGRRGVQRGGGHRPPDREPPRARVPAAEARARRLERRVE